MLNSRKLKAQETKKKIYESAYLLFEKYGFANVSVDSIVELAGVSKGTFYVHFESKGALIAKMTANVVGDLDLNYKTYLESLPDGTPITEGIILLTEKIATVIADTLGYQQMKVIYEALLNRTIDGDQVFGYNRGLYQLFRDLIKLGIENGEFQAELPVDIIASHCILSVRGITYEWCIRHPNFDLKKHSRIHMEILIQGIKRQ